MRLGTFPKTTVDNIRLKIVYSEWLQDTEVLTAYEFTSDPAGLVIASAEIKDGTSLVFFVGGGEEGESYNMIATILTDGGQTRQDYIVVTVSNP